MDAKIYISDDETLVIQTDSATEKYAFKKWMEKNKAPRTEYHIELIKND